MSEYSATEYIKRSNDELKKLRSLLFDVCEEIEHFNCTNCLGWKLEEWKRDNGARALDE